MLMSGKEYLESIRDGRRVYIGSERVEDVTTHPAFRNAAHLYSWNSVAKGVIAAAQGRLTELPPPTTPAAGLGA